MEMAEDCQCCQFLAVSAQTYSCKESVAVYQCLEVAMLSIIR